MHAIAHITGGGMPGNLDGCCPPAPTPWSTAALGRAPVFGEIRRLGDVDEAEMARVFNLGIGMVLVVDAAGGGRRRRRPR